MPSLEDNYTRYPRAILWLLREGEVTIGGQGRDTEPQFVAHVDPFYISKLPVTNAQYEAFAPGYQRHPTSVGDEDPAVGVSFHDAVAYCQWYGGVSKKPMRLPTEIEWEYACRGGEAARYPFGDDVSRADEFLWDAVNTQGRVAPLQSKTPNGFGLYGMLGGVWEWTASLYGAYPIDPSLNRDDPRTPGRRVLRGGSFRTHRDSMGSAVRRGERPDAQLDDVGFRIARSLRNDEPGEPGE